MKSKDQLILEQSYELIQARQFLMSKGYTKEEFDALVAEGAVWDAVKGAAKSAGKYVAPLAAAAGMMGGAAYGNTIDDQLKDIQNNRAQLVQSVTDKSNAEHKVTQQSEDQLISSTAQKAFGNTITDEGISALKQVASFINYRDPDKAKKIVQIIQGAAKQLNGKGQDKTQVYSAASQIQSGLR